ncbi:MAG: hypothetical protein GY856_35555, partial [bacterium]|nr:hypothetical protein [bacterium]
MSSDFRFFQFQRVLPRSAGGPAAGAPAFRTMVLAALLLAPAMVRAGAEAPGVALAPYPKPLRPTHHVPGTDSPIEIDAVLDEAAWSEALNLSLDYET